MDWNRMIVTDILSIKTVHFSKGGHVSILDRKCWALVLTDDGQLTYRHKNRDFLLDSNSAVILPKGQSYTILRQKEGNFQVIDFECEGFFADTFTMFSVENAKSIVKEILYLKKASLHDENRFLVIGEFYKLLHQLTQADSVGTVRLTPAMEYLKKYYTTDVDNSTLASKCYIGEEHFRKLFKKTYGMSPKQYVIHLRLNRAKQLLAEGTMKINEIAIRCGFSNPYHFTRMFKEKNNETPSAFMERSRAYGM
ncbi:MAG: helix-turn-helix transcriptional regulator [Clostridia bacterium]|nr:helix-turn-helix transcriptional regulator [Clostridia bacterium]